MLIITFTDAKTELCSSELQVSCFESEISDICLSLHLWDLNRWRLWMPSSCSKVTCGCSPGMLSVGQSWWTSTYPLQLPLSMSVSSLLSLITIVLSPGSSSSKHQQPQTGALNTHQPLTHVSRWHITSCILCVSCGTFVSLTRGIWFQPDHLLQPLMSEVFPSWEGPGLISGLKCPCYIHYRDVRVGQPCFLVCFSSTTTSSPVSHPAASNVFVPFCFITNWNLERHHNSTCCYLRLHTYILGVRLPAALGCKSCKALFYTANIRTICITKYTSFSFDPTSTLP